jgi:pyruvate/2-oxoglutarate dehydrogenase complex dihydrolipoamide dehydrogenase (E3) component
VHVDSYLRTSAPRIFAAGDITGRLMLVLQAAQEGFVAATNVVRGMTTTLGEELSPIGSFTEPEYASGRTDRGEGSQNARCGRSGDAL